MEVLLSAEGIFPETSRACGQVCSTYSSSCCLRILSCLWIKEQSWAERLERRELERRQWFCHAVLERISTGRKAYNSHASYQISALQDHFSIALQHQNSVFPSTKPDWYCIHIITNNETPATSSPPYPPPPATSPAYKWVIFCYYHLFVVLFLLLYFFGFVSTLFAWLPKIMKGEVADASGVSITTWSYKTLKQT